MHIIFVITTTFFQAAVLRCVGAATVVVGHALHNDLEALRMTHARVVDTSLIFSTPLQHTRLGLKDAVLEVSEVFMQVCVEVVEGLSR